jgi:hypothetical protein
LLDERSRRPLVAAESKAWRLGGISAVSKATGVSRQVIRQGLGELEQSPTPPVGRIRRPGGGRKKATQKDPTLVADLEKLVEPTTRGGPESCLRWTCKSVRTLAEELEQMGHDVSYPVIAELLHEMEYNLQANRKTKEGDSHPDRDAQFAHINTRVQRYIGLKQPVISVEGISGRFQKRGAGVETEGEPEKVRVHDFVIPDIGRAALWDCQSALCHARARTAAVRQAPRRMASCLTFAPLLWRPSAAGGTRWARRNTRQPSGY